MLEILRRYFRRSLHRFYLIAGGLLALIALYGYFAYPDLRRMPKLLVSLFAIDSLIYFFVGRDWPAVRLIMLVFIYLIELSAIGYYFLLRFSFL
jgi:hypothetical protein